MTTFKEKAEQYVREQLPELMELSFGCEVVSRRGNQGTIVLEVDNGLYISFKEIPANLSVKQKKEIKIIGHPIQLHHWLRVLAEEPSLVDSMGLIDADFGINGHLIFQFKGEDVRFNLTTGQPATEADYQAFCNIVGV